MPPLIPIETLNYYLTKSGFPKFRQWFSSVEIFKPIFVELDSLTTSIINSTWLEDKLRKDSLLKIRVLIMKHIENILNISPDNYFQLWINSIQQYCFQGGYGHRIQYSGEVPHHWCISSNDYDKIINIPENVKLCGIICDKYINLSDTPEQMYWSS